MLILWFCVFYIKSIECEFLLDINNPVSLNINGSTGNNSVVFVQQIPNTTDIIAVFSNGFIATFTNTL
jgi:hypothetical protein